MTYPTFAELNLSGADDIFVYANIIWPWFTPLVLFIFFGIALTTSFIVQRRSFQQVNFSASFASSSFATFIVAVAMTLKSGIINKSTLVFIFSFMVIFVTWFLTSRDSSQA